MNVISKLPTQPSINFNGWKKLFKRKTSCGPFDCKEDKILKMFFFNDGDSYKSNLVGATELKSLLTTV